jgi:hypothetical protein
MLPSEPNIFHGRESELSGVLQLFHQKTPRVAILGAGGMGKTSLAQAISFEVFWVPSITQKLLADMTSLGSFFITCDAAATQVELAVLVGAHLGLKPGKYLTHLVIQPFVRSPDSLLILDNLETSWELIESCGNIEEFLSLLTGVDHLALVAISAWSCVPSAISRNVCRAASCSKGFKGCRNGRVQATLAGLSAPCIVI